MRRPWRNASPAVFLVAGGVLLGVGIALGTVLLLAETRAAAIKDDTYNLRNQSRLAAAQTAQLLQAVRQPFTLLEHPGAQPGVVTPEDFAAAMMDESVEHDLTRMVAVSPFLARLAILDPQGRTIVSSRDSAAPLASAADPDLVAAVAAAPVAVFQVGMPVVDMAGVWTVQFARSFTARSGARLGMLLATARVRHLEELVTTLAANPTGMIALLRTDGISLARYPTARGTTGNRFALSDGASSLLTAPDGTTLRLTSPVDGVTRLVAKTQVQGYPIVATASVPMDTVLANWTRLARWLVISAVTLEAGITALVLLGLRQIGAQALLARAEAARVSGELAHADERERAEREQCQHYARFATAMDHLAQGVAVFDAMGRLTLANRRLAALFGQSAACVRRGMSPENLMALAQEGGIDRPSLSAIRNRIVALSRHRQGGTFTAPVGSDGRSLSVHVQPFPDGGFVTTFEDVTERQQSHARILHMAHHDALTNLPNRALLQQRLAEAMALCGRGEAFALLCIDLDGFKEVNDTLGHAAGDVLLQDVARRLQRCVREVDTAARLGGDEFAVIQRKVDLPGDATMLAQRLLTELGLPYQVLGEEAAVAASIGIAFAPADGETADMLLKNADMALYRAKANGRGRFCLFEKSMDAEARRRRTLEIELRRSVEDGDFEPFYQPLVDTATRRIRGFEALVRWHHPQRGLVMPAEFIGLAEETGLVVPIGEQMLRSACADAARWPAELKVAVNLSPVQIRQGNRLVRVVEAALAASGLRAGRLDLEITESVLLQDTQETLATLHDLKALGVQITMDDFGTGYSSLSYLRRFPFDKVKIDRSFVCELGERADNDTIVRAMTGLCDDLGMATTAEGVETEAQMRLLSAMGCGEVQGYLFSRPVPATQVAPLLRQMAAVSPSPDCVVPAA